MVSTLRPIVVVMGVSGVGKTTVASALADALGWPFQEGDDLHTPGNIAKMSAGEPLTDADRIPWLDRIGAWMDERAAAGEAGIVTCSALRRAYRDRLRSGRPQVRFLHLTADPSVVRRRVGSRQHHFMPSSLVESQLEALEPLQSDEPGVEVRSSGTTEQMVTKALDALGESVR
ncbi:MAG: gluconokinase [Nocardioidaceae bacterium]|nr:gluconokinase [Nocardioidaceae bacterium]